MMINWIEFRTFISNLFLQLLKAAIMTSASLEDLCEYLKRKCKLPPAAINNANELLGKYYERKKDFDLIIKDGKVLVLAKKTPTATPEFS